MKAGIAYNPKIPNALNKCELIREELKKKGVEPSFMATIFNLPPEAKCDVLVIVGGDGSMLHSVRWLMEHDVPALGLKLGRLGFLMAYSFEEHERAILDLVEGRLKETKLDLMSVEYGNIREWALNDMVVERFDSYRTLEVCVETSEGELCFLGDGVVVSSAVGSTAYNLAVGGAIVMPHLRVLQIAPMNVHGTLRTSVVIGEHEKLSVRLRDGTAKMVVDGYRVYKLDKDEEVLVSLSTRSVRILGNANRTFFELLKRKFNYGVGKLRG
ncbi:MAG: NAD(+)/NADH kinase [Thermotogae bacterium]|nr:NAD(+)/NADH kinase [Thermotogota bacterium]